MHIFLVFTGTGEPVPLISLFVGVFTSVYKFYIQIVQYTQTHLYIYTDAFCCSDVLLGLYDGFVTRYGVIHIAGCCNCESIVF